MVSSMTKSNSRRLLTLPRVTTLLSSLLVALGSGTNYLFSAYAPQLGSQLHITHTSLNIIGLAGNMGGSITGPFLGMQVDKRGPRDLLIGAFFLLLLGYSGIRYVYNSGPPPSEFITPTSFGLLVACAFMVGAGGHAGTTGAMNATAKSFPDRARATATGIVISGYGLSAFLFSVLSHTIFRGDTSSFLLLLSLGTSFPMMVGFFLVRPIPLSASEIISSAEYDIINNVSAGGIETSAVFQHSNESRALLLSNTTEELPMSSSNNGVLSRTDIPLELDPSRSPSPELSLGHSRSSNHQPAFRGVIGENLPDIHGKQLWISTDFWIVFIILSLLSGTGLMYINNVGSISQALYAKENPNYDEVVALRWQATQVSAISITNFTGRILIGLASDFAKNYLRFPRSYCFSLVASLFILSQIMAIATDDVEDLWKASLTLGLAYGGLFGLSPTITIEWFGIAHFSENWGYLLLSPILGANFFSIAFGRNLDAHSAPSTEPPTTNSTSIPNISSTVLGRAEIHSERTCLEGRDCYVTSFYITIVACCISLFLSVWAGWRDRRKLAASMRSGKKNASEVVWEEDEEE